jgi:hypothetical protein
MESYVITITEIDDADDAVRMLHREMGRFGLPEKLKKNSFGIVTTHADAIRSGVLKAVSRALPFETAGFATDSQSPNGETGNYLLSVMVLTSDDCNFSAGAIYNVTEYSEVENITRNRYQDLTLSLPSPAKLCLLYTPRQSNRFPGEYIDAISAVDPDVSVFGAVSSDTEDLMDGSQDGVFTISNGEALDDGIVMVLISGNVSPRFFISSFTEDSIRMKDIGIVTKCNKNVLIEINNMPAVKFLEKTGFFGAEGSEVRLSTATATAAFVFDYGTGRDVSRSFPEMSDDGNSIICMGHLQEGARISIAICMPDIIVETTHEIVDKVKASGMKTAILYSCIGRRLAMLNNPMAEYEVMQSKLKNVNYITCHTGGELCPVMSNESRKLTNSEHNLTLIACVF